MNESWAIAEIIWSILLALDFCVLIGVLSYYFCERKYGKQILSRREKKV
jgi:hypothetical protein